MLRGHLKILTLLALRKGSKSGYDLMKFIEGRTGQKPSPGSIYPMLTGMLKAHLVVFKKKDRTKEYSITKKGMSYMKDVSEQELDCIGKLIMALSQTKEELKRL